MPLPEDHTTVSLPQLDPYLATNAEPTDLVFIWDALSASLKYASVAQLRGDADVVDPGDTPAVGTSTFKINNLSDSYSYDAETGHTTIEDMRLLGKTGYVVRNTKFQADFKPSQMEYLPVDGKAILYNFELDNDDDYISVTVDGSMNSFATMSYKALSDRIAAAEAMLIVFKPTALGGAGACIAWYKAIADIPAGWAPVDDIAGRMLINIDPANAAFNAIFKKDGGEKIKLGVEHIPEMDPANGEFNRLLKYDGLGTAANVDSSDLPGTQQPNLLDSKVIKKVGTPAADQAEINFMNPYVVVCYIEYVGII